MDRQRLRALMFIGGLLIAHLVLFWLGCCTPMAFFIYYAGLAGGALMFGWPIIGVITLLALGTHFVVPKRLSADDVSRIWVAGVMVLIFVALALGIYQVMI